MLYERLRKSLKDHAKSIRKDKTLSDSERERLLSFNFFKQEELSIANDLCYSDEILDRIWLAETEGDVTRAMMAGRAALA